MAHCQASSTWSARSASDAVVAVRRAQRHAEAELAKLKKKPARMLGITDLKRELELRKARGGGIEALLKPGRENKHMLRLRVEEEREKDALPAFLKKGDDDSDDEGGGGGGQKIRKLWWVEQAKRAEKRAKDKERADFLSQRRKTAGGCGSSFNFDPMLDQGSL